MVIYWLNNSSPGAQFSDNSADFTADCSGIDDTVYESYTDLIYTNRNHNDAAEVTLLHVGDLNFVV